MKPIYALAATAFSVLVVSSTAGAADVDKLKVLYVGDVGTPRAQQFTDFLKQNAGRFETAVRGAFKPNQAEGFDVVVLDWPQSVTARDERLKRSPIGDRETWTKPTVLLGSAGLNLAVVWKVRGGSG